MLFCIPEVIGHQSHTQTGGWFRVKIEDSFLACDIDLFGNIPHACIRSWLWRGHRGLWDRAMRLLSLAVSGQRVNRDPPFIPEIFNTLNRLHRFLGQRIRMHVGCCGGIWRLPVCERDERSGESERDWSRRDRGWSSIISSLDLINKWVEIWKISFDEL